MEENAIQSSVDAFIGRLEETISMNLGEDEKNQIRTWEIGKALSPLVSMHGWSVYKKEVLGNIFNRAMDDLVNANPAKPADVLAAHSIAYVVKHIISATEHIVEEYILRSQETPSVIKAALQPQV